MLQIVWNWMLVAVFPLLAGLLFRWLLRRWRRGWLLTAGAAALALILFLWASTIPIPGSEGPMLWTIQAACLTLGAGVVELFFKLKRRLLMKNARVLLDTGVPFYFTTTLASPNVSRASWSRASWRTAWVP